MRPKSIPSICISIAALMIVDPAWAQQPSSAKEALILRRITEYWRDGDYVSAKRQILEFLEKNPQTALRDPLSAMLGDLYFQERDYRQALATYDQIGNPEIKRKTFFNHLQAEFELKNYESVVEKAENHLRLTKEDDKKVEIKIRYLLAEAAFRQALASKDLEQRSSYLKVAKPHFKILTQTEVGDRALFPLAEIHRLLKEDQRASELFLQLAQKYPMHRERFLFQAGVLQISMDKRQAIQTFHQVYQMGGKRARLAAFNELILLYQNGQYEEYLSFFPHVAEQMPEEKMPLLKFYEGKSFYALADYDQAVAALENFVESKPPKSKELKTSLLLLVNCARQLKDAPLLDRTLYSFKSTFPQDHELGKVLFTHAQLCRETGNHAAALQDLKLLLSDFPQFPDRELVVYDLGLLLEQAGQIEQAREAFLSFVEEYPNSQRENAAWRHLINCSIEELKNPTQAHSNESKEGFVRMLDKALQKTDLLNEKERNQYALLRVKYLCDLSKQQDAIPLLSQYLADTVDEDYLAEAHLLMAACLQKTGGNRDLFIQHGEKALSLRPQLPEGEILHLELYNAYLSSAFAEQEEEQREKLLSKAAHHLYDSGSWKSGSVKKENFTWLTHYYFEKALQDPTACERASHLFHSLLGIQGATGQLTLTPESIHLEPEVLNYATLLGFQKRTADQIAVLEALVRKQEVQPDLPWKYKKRSLLELAKSYEQNGQYENAMRSYQFLISGGNPYSTLTNTAQLHLAKLQYRLLSAEKKRADSPDVVSILHRLKDLQIQKRLAAEPIHLEAALQYAELRSTLADQEEKASASLFFLQRMREDFLANDDLLVQEYRSQCERLPDKNLILTAYMRYIEAEMLRNQAAIARSENDEDYAIECEQQALGMLDELLEEPETIQPYLIEHVKKSHKQIAK